MKKGSGSDPFADVVQEESDESGGEETTDETGSVSDSGPESEQSTADQAADTTADSTDAADVTETAETTETGDASTESDADSSEKIVSEPPQAGADDNGVPWVYVRDNVKQDREMVQFYLRDYLVDAEGEFVDAVSEELGTDVSKTDVREAAYEAAMHNVDEVADRLRDWGFESEK
ncbi:hypothetical protein GS429_00335 [Natronorubrum sp. JWXQ-INN-674]|uniref:Acyl-CoA dehydrogenase n=1 Tax=Natronorubrum halalkaliphilum TaxID=2691917 RepID=A0A6B0VGC5_9EURY|nr:hypothetical protein [Natronorubrum halalkaliphilum]MXV60540.1 hypothetical protein [Natronorubrum halalkaliphilum]